MPWFGTLNCTDSGGLDQPPIVAIDAPCIDSKWPNNGAIL